MDTKKNMSCEECGATQRRHLRKCFQTSSQYKSTKHGDVDIDINSGALWGDRSQPSVIRGLKETQLHIAKPGKPGRESREYRSILVAIGARRGRSPQQVEPGGAERGPADVSPQPAHAWDHD